MEFDILLSERHAASISSSFSITFKSWSSCSVTPKSVVSTVLSLQLCPHEHPLWLLFWQFSVVGFKSWPENVRLCGVTNFVWLLLVKFSLLIVLPFWLLMIVFDTGGTGLPCLSANTSGVDTEWRKNRQRQFSPSEWSINIGHALKCSCLGWIVLLREDWLVECRREDTCCWAMHNSWSDEGSPPLPPLTKVSEHWRHSLVTPFASFRRPSTGELWVYTRNALSLDAKRVNLALRWRISFSLDFSCRSLSDTCSWRNPILSFVVCKG